jgi:hypothetical protein
MSSPRPQLPASREPPVVIARLVRLTCQLVKRGGLADKRRCHNQPSLGQIRATICLRARLFVCVIVASYCRVLLITLLECAYSTTWGAEAHTY